MPLKAVLRYLAMPLRTAPLLFIVVFSVLFVIAVQGGLFSIFLLILTVSWFFKYSFVFLDYVIDGRPEPPVLSVEMANPVEQRPLGMLLILFAFYFISLRVGAWVGVGAARIVQAIVLAAVPAMVSTMSMSGRFLDALNPKAVFGIIFRIPFAYFGLLALIGLLWLLPWLTLRTLHIEPPLILSTMLFMYLWLAMMTCVGGLMYERRLDLGIDVANSPERTAERENAAIERERDKLFDTVFAQLRGGAFANAGAEVRRLLESSARPLDEFRWLYKKASQLPDGSLAEYLVQLALPRLLEARANGEALDCVRARLNANPNFRPTQGSLALRMAALARDAGDRRIAQALVQDFEQCFPADAAAAMAAKMRADLSRE